MCVTNTTHRRVQAVTLTPNQIGLGNGSCSALSQRLLGAFGSATPATLSTQQPSSSQSAQQAAATATTSSMDFPTSLSMMMMHNSNHHHNLYGHSRLPLPDVSSDSVTGTGGAKSRPKRRRKPQKPGKTAKMNDRHFVVHNYHDHAMDPPPLNSSSNTDTCLHADDACWDHDEHDIHDSNHHRRRGGVAIAFPLKLHAVLDQVEHDGYSHVISWSPHGRCFVIHQPKQFVDEVMPKYFRQSKLTSFQRQLNLYGFARLTRGPDAGGYYHELFLRNREHLCSKMIRTKVKGTKFKAASSPDSEPDFYAMPPVSVTPALQQASQQIVTPHHSSDEEGSGSASTGEDDVTEQDNMSSSCEDSSRQALAQQQVYQQQASSLYASIPPAPVPLYASAPVSISYVNNNSNSNGSSVPFWMMMNSTSNKLANTDQILDDAVDELFLNELNEQDNLTDFVADWGNNNTEAINNTNNNNFGSAGFDSSYYLNDDAQLGFMLEKLLED